MAVEQRLPALPAIGLLTKPFDGQSINGVAGRADDVEAGGHGGIPVEGESRRCGVAGSNA
jgi:hypothetical protein